MTDPATEKIVSARSWLVHMPFKSAISWAGGARTGTTRVIVEIETEGGTKAYGESISLLDYVPEVLNKVVLPAMRGWSVFDTEGFFRLIQGSGYYHHKRAAVMATCAAEMAMWDAIGKIAGQPLYRLFGGAYRKNIEMVCYLFISDPTGLAEAAKAAYAEGYRSFQLKVGLNEAQDIAIVKAVREALGDGVHIRADVNSAWTIGTAKRQLEKLRPYDLAYIEQPLELDDLAGHRHLRQTQSTPVALDESAYTLADVANILKAEAADVLLLDPQEHGGLSPARKCAALAAAWNMPVGLHSGGELGLAQAAYLHLAASCQPMSLAIDTELPYLSDDIISRKFKITDGHLPVPEAPGLGVEVDLDAVSKYEIDHVPQAYLDADRRGWFSTKPAY